MNYLIHHVSSQYIVDRRCFKQFRSKVTMTTIKPATYWKDQWYQQHQ